MAQNKYHLQFEGYWRLPNIGGVPDQSGVYCVYTCKFNPETQKIKLIKIIYIGEASNVRGRISSHEKTNIWRRYLEKGEELCFNFAPVKEGRERVEAACIHKHKPPENTTYRDKFPFDQTSVNTAGCKRFLYSQFTVFRT